MRSLFQAVSALPAMFAIGASQYPVSSAQTLTREQALTLPPSALAQIALQSISGKYVEVSRPTFSGMMGPKAPLMDLEFATVPESSGNPGVCKATILNMQFDVPRNAKAYDGTTPVSASSMSTETVFKVVGDARPLPDNWNDKYDAYLRNKCAGAGRVLPSETADLRQIGFFKLKAGNENDSWLTARALQLATTDSYSRDSKIICHTASKQPGPKECNDVKALLRSLQLTALTEASFMPCPDQLNRYCIHGQFFRSALGNSRTFWEIELRAQVHDPQYSDHDITHIDSITVSDGFAIYD